MKKKVIGDSQVLIKDITKPFGFRETRKSAYQRNKNVVLPLDEFLKNLGY